MIIKMELFELAPSRKARIASFRDGLREEFRRRLEDLGFCRGASIELLRKIPFGGPRVYRVCDAVFSIEPDIARHILIEYET